jgi:tRNA pseudouridine65 synthase
LALELLYQSERFVVVNKPAGLLMHRTNISQDTVFLLQQLRNQLGIKVHAVNRLDRGTSGAVLFALNPDAARIGEAAFSARTVDKSYLGVVRGYIPSQRINTPLSDEGSTERKEALTEITALAQIELPIAIGRYQQQRYSLIRAVARTGRMHQIRRHLHQVFHPLIGDTTHGEGRHNRLFREHFDCARLLLHSRHLRLDLDGEHINVMAPLDHSFERVVGAFAWTHAVNADALHCAT